MFFMDEDHWNIEDEDDHDPEQRQWNWINNSENGRKKSDNMMNFEGAMMKNDDEHWKKMKMIH